MYIWSCVYKNLYPSQARMSHAYTYELKLRPAFPRMPQARDQLCIKDIERMQIRLPFFFILAQKQGMLKFPTCT